MQGAFLWAQLLCSADLNALLLPPGSAQGQRKGKVSWGNLNEYLDKGMLSTDRVDLLKPPPIPSLSATDTRGTRPPVLRAMSARGGGQHTHPARASSLSLDLRLILCQGRNYTFTLMSRLSNPFTPASVLNKISCWQKDTLLSVL